MPGLLVYAFYLFRYFLLDQAFFLLKGVFPDRPNPWYGSPAIIKKNTIFILKFNNVKMPIIIRRLIIELKKKPEY